MEAAVEHADLAADAARQDQMRDQIGALNAAEALAGLAAEAPWDRRAAEADQVAAIRQEAEALVQAAGQARDQAVSEVRAEAGQARAEAEDAGRAAEAAAREREEIAARLAAAPVSKPPGSAWPRPPPSSASSAPRTPPRWPGPPTRTVTVLTGSPGR